MRSEQPASNAKAMAEFFRGVAGWQREMAREYARDTWSAHTAKGLEELANYVESLPANDPRLRKLEKMSVRGGIFSPVSLRASQLISSFRSRDPNQDCDAFLTFLAKDIARYITDRAHHAGQLDE